MASATGRRLKRDLHGESLPGSILLVLDTLGVYTATIVPGDPGSLDLAGRLPDVLATLTTVAAAAAIVWVWLASSALACAPMPSSSRRSRPRRSRSSRFAKVISPQFLTWLLPLVPLVAGRAGRLAGRPARGRR